MNFQENQTVETGSAQNPAGESAALLADAAVNTELSATELDALAGGGLCCFYGYPNHNQTATADDAAQTAPSNLTPETELTATDLDTVAGGGLCCLYGNPNHNQTLAN